ncbi:hypothetical protein LshimejAT787_1600810 [Lyophyllum shimeji]|uniref:DUF7598 domain-containing protein n=1 Tax=Lyophyllum shimeji TaxID=47721 RepID=A0A9P3PYV3_LYOSH|nr:hypothetical protein LshimejAT787_1600810 [Lyophyllum shimeji]
MLPPRAYTFIGLNGIRILSIIALTLVFASNIVTLVNDIKAVNHFVAGGKVVSNSTTDASTINSTLHTSDMDYISGSTVPNQPAGAFWAVLNRLLIIGQSIVLIMSEFGWPAAFFDRYFPVLGKDFGVGALGIMQCLIGAAILSHRVDTFTLVAAFFLFSVGCLNILVGLIWRESAKAKRSITSWREHAKSALPTHVAGVDVRPMMSAAPSFVSNVWSGSDDKARASEAGSGKSGFGFGRQGEKAAGLKGYLISKPIESLPRYAPKPMPTGNSDATAVYALREQLSHNEGRVRCSLAMTLPRSAKTRIGQREHQTLAMFELVLFRVLGLVNLCYAVLCASVVLDFKADHEPNADPHLHDLQAENDALGACFLVGAGCINFAVACVRVYQAGAHSSAADWATTVSFVLAGGLNHATAYLFLRTRLRAVVHVSGSEVCRNVKEYGSLEKC